MNWLSRWMMGRNGFDQLCMGTLVASLLVLLVTRMSGWMYLDILSLLLLMLCWFRALSRNVYKRQAENAKFMRLWGPVSQAIGRAFWRIRGAFSRFSRRLRERKTYRFYRCPSCKQKLRVPKGKGQLSITCPKCHNAFMKKT